jgi:hypothetical protein
VLVLLAEAKFADTWSEDQYPYWIDGDHVNETLENVALAERVVSRRDARTTSAPRSGTPEYMREWREKHKPAVRESQARYTSRRRAVLEAAEEIEDDPVLDRLRNAVLGDAGGSSPAKQG